MSTTNYPTQDATPTVTRRPLQMQENTGSASQRSGNRRSLSVKLRDLFRKDSSASNRPVNNRRSPTSPARHSSSSPVATSDATHLHAPSIPWPFGKKKSNSSTTVNTSKTNKIKVKKEIPSLSTGRDTAMLLLGRVAKVKTSRYIFYTILLQLK